MAFFGLAGLAQIRVRRFAGSSMASRRLQSSFGATRHCATSRAAVAVAGGARVIEVAQVVVLLVTQLHAAAGRDQLGLRLGRERFPAACPDLQLQGAPTTTAQPQSLAYYPRSLASSTTPVAATGTMSDTSCMVCGLTSDPFIVLLCDGCENEAHLACVGLSHVPEGEWFCSSCCGRGLGHSQPRAAKATKSPRPRRPRPGRRGPQVAKSAATFRGPRREPDEIDEVDGIVISAFSGPSSAQAPRVGGESSRSPSRPKKRPRTHQHRARVPAQPPKPPGAVVWCPGPERRVVAR